MANQASDFWLNITDRQKDMRVLFFDEQKSKQGIIRSGTDDSVWAQDGPSSSKWKADLVFRFSVTIPALGIVNGEFKSVRGLNSDEWDYETYREGGDNGPEHLLPKNRKSGKLILERALRHPDPFVQWCITMDTGIMLRQLITISLLDKQVPVAMWIIPQCQISKIEGPELDAMSSEIATSRVELVHNGLITVAM